MNRSSSPRCRTASFASALISLSSSDLARSRRRVRAASSTALALTSLASARANSISAPYLLAMSDMLRSKSLIFSRLSTTCSFCFMPRLANRPSISRRKSSSRRRRRFSCATVLARASLSALTSECSFSSATIRRFCSRIRLTPESYRSSTDASIDRLRSSNRASHSRVSVARSAINLRSPSAAFWSSRRRNSSHSSLFAFSLASTFS